MEFNYQGQENKQPQIILIGGTNGTGKTPLARELYTTFQLDHLLETPFVRESLRTVLTTDQAPSLFGHTYAVDPVIPHLIQQSRLLKPAIIRIIEGAKSESTSLVVEGNHLLPELYHDIPVSLFVILERPANHYGWVTGSSHRRRQVDATAMQRIVKMGEYIEESARKLDLPLIHYGSDSINVITRLLKKEY